MAVIKHYEWLDAMLGGWTHSAIDLDTDDIDASLLDETDSGTITASFVDYAEVNAADVVATANLPSIASIINGVVTLTGALTMPSVSGDQAEFLTVFKNSGDPATSPLIITWDTASDGLPVLPNGGDVVSTWGSNILVSFA